MKICKCILIYQKLSKSDIHFFYFLKECQIRFFKSKVFNYNVIHQYRGTLIPQKVIICRQLYFQPFLSKSDIFYNIEDGENIDRPYL